MAMKTFVITVAGVAASSYDPDAATVYADRCCDGSCSGCRCGSGEGSGCTTCECAEFTAHALCAGGYFSYSWGGKCNPGTDYYADWKGYNLRMVGELKKALKEKKGWHTTSSAKKGDVLIYGNNQHACFARSPHHVDCHNNNHCGATISGIASGFGGQYVILTPPASSDAFEVELESEEIVLYANETSHSAVQEDEHVAVSNCHPMEFVARKWLNAANYKSSGDPHHCPNAVSVAWAESSGCCQATSSAGDRGLWQINRPAHPDVSDDCAYDCVCNGQAAFKISSKGNDWSPWVTFNNGAYKQYHHAAAEACQSQEAALMMESEAQVTV